MPELTPEAAAAQEELFLNRVRAAMESAGEILDPESGDAIAVGRASPVEYDEGEEIHRMMASLGVYAPGLLERMPRNRCLVWELKRRSLLPGRTRLVVVAAVVSPIRELIRGERTQPRASFSSLARIVRDHLSGDGPARLAGVYSPTGWEAGIRLDAVRRPGLGVWLFEPGLAGGFAPAFGRSERPPPPFDIESRQERLERVIQWVEERRFDLLMKGLCAADATRDLEMRPADVRAGLEEAARRDEFLVLDEGDDLYLRRA